MLALLLALATLSPVRAADLPPAEVANEHEPIQFFERYQPSYFLLGRPNTKVQISFKIQAFRNFPIYFGYTQLMMWDLFKTSAPFRDINYSPDFFYRMNFDAAPEASRTLDLGIRHESNGVDGDISRSWNRVFARYMSTQMMATRGIWWSGEIWIPYGMTDAPSKLLPRYRGLWQAELGLTDLLRGIFEVNEVILRVYGGGASRVNPLKGGQEITYREKRTSRAFLLPLYLQIFHGYGENLLDAPDERWGVRAGIGF
jgi:phospholipase A1